jgi:hypothetical protein
LLVLGKIAGRLFVFILDPALNTQLFKENDFGEWEESFQFNEINNVLIA